MARKESLGLGKGLSELLGELERGPEAAETAAVRIAFIEPNREQPRRRFDAEGLETLAESIRTHGVITPVVLRKIGDERYQLIAGERRYRAARMAGLEELPARVIEADDAQAYELALVENLQREDLDPMEEAEGYRTLIEDYGLSQTAAAARVGKSRPAVANALRLLALPEEVRALVRDGKLSAGHARALLTVEGDKNRVAAARTVMRRDMSVRQAERFCRRFGKDAPEKPAGEIDYAKDLAVRLSERFGRKVSVTCRRGRGAVMLHYHSLDDLDVLLARLEGNGEKK